MNSAERASQLFQLSRNDVEKLEDVNYRTLFNFTDDMIAKHAACAEVIIAAYDVYAQICENKEPGPYSPKLTKEDWLWFKEDYSINDARKPDIIGWGYSDDCASFHSDGFDADEVEGRFRWFGLYLGDKKIGDIKMDYRDNWECQIRSLENGEMLRVVDERTEMEKTCDDE